MNNTIKLTKKETDAVRSIIEDDFSDPVGLVKSIGYNPAEFFQYGHFEILDLRGSDIREISFRGSYLGRVIISQNQISHFMHEDAAAVEYIEVKPNVKSSVVNSPGSSHVLSHPVLGANQSQDDVYLPDYFVEVHADLNQPIIVGRWGSGQTALLLKRTVNVRNFLYDEKDPFDRPWFIEGGAIKMEMVLNYIGGLEDNRHKIYAILARMWEGEILLRTILTLQRIRSKVSNRIASKAWNIIKDSIFQEIFPEGLWENKNLLQSLFSNNENLNKSPHKEVKYLDLILSKETKRCIFECIDELKKIQVSYPVIAIEPIETPFSEKYNLETSLISDLVSSLLNVWYQKFRPERRDCNLSVNISIPWNLYYPEKTAFPDKLPNYTCHVSWTKSALRTLISSRLLWEANKADTNHSSVGDFGALWSLYFVEVVESLPNFDSPGRLENSFDYLCRHASWRARDLILLTRECIEAYCKIHNISHIKFFTEPDQIEASIIRKVASSYCIRTAPLRIEEYSRKSGRSSKLAEAMFRGLTSPVSRQALLDSFLEALGVSGKPNEANLLTELWNAELIGLALEFYDKGSETNFANTFGDDVIRRFTGSDKVGEKSLQSVAFLFRYSTAESWNVNAIMAKYQNHKIVVNPLFYEYFGIKSTSQYPIGI